MSPTKTGSLNTKEFTATVTTGPCARSHAGMLPAMSTCAMTQPPKMVPCALVSAGIGTMRRTGWRSGAGIVMPRLSLTASCRLALLERAPQDLPGRGLRQRVLERDDVGHLVGGHLRARPGDHVLGAHLPAPLG